MPKFKHHESFVNYLYEVHVEQLKSAKKDRSESKKREASQMSENSLPEVQKIDKTSSSNIFERKPLPAAANVLRRRTMQFKNNKTPQIHSKI